MIDWLRFFDEAIAAVQQPFAEVLHASGCREGWVQGELFRAGRHFGIKVNQRLPSYAGQADLSATGMIAEIKIVGADHKPDMRNRIESDVQRLCNARTDDTVCYMILIVPTSSAAGVLNEYLSTCSFSKVCLEREFIGFKVKIWRL